MLVIDFGVEMGSGLGGVGVRACDLAAAFSTITPTVLASPDQPSDDVRRSWPTVTFQHQAAPGVGNVAIYGYGSDPATMARARAQGAVCVFDAIVWPLEFLTYQNVRDAPEPGQRFARHVERYREQLALADGFLVASEKEKAVLAGTLAAFGLSEHLLADASLDRSIRILPVGYSSNCVIPASPPQREQPRPAFVWNGGLWNHYEPTAAVRALTRLHARGIEAELHFLYPQLGRPTDALASALDSAGGHVHFHNGSLDFDRRARALHQAVAAVALYDPCALWDLCPPMRLRESLVYDLPIIAPSRGALGELISDAGCGFACSSLDPEKVADAMEMGLDAALRGAAVSGIARLRERYRYEDLVPDVLEWLERLSR